MEIGLGRGVNLGTDIGLYDGDQTGVLDGLAQGIYNENRLYQENINLPIVKNGLIIYLDAGNPYSYSGSGSGLIWSDLSGNGNNGTLTNGPTFSSANGGSIVFDGSNDRVNLPTKTYTFVSGTTVEMWFNPAVIGGTYRYLVHFGESGADTFILYIEISNTRITAKIGSSEADTDINIAPVNQWLQFVFVANGTNHIFYKNGAFHRTFNISAIPTSISRSPFIGARFTGGELFNGNIAITRIYNRGLSAAEVLQNFNVTKARFRL